MKWFLVVSNWSMMCSWWWLIDMLFTDMILLIIEMMYSTIWWWWWWCYCCCIPLYVVVVDKIMMMIDMFYSMRFIWLYVNRDDAFVDNDDGWTRYVEDLTIMKVFVLTIFRTNLIYKSRESINEWFILDILFNVIWIWDMFKHLITLSIHHFMITMTTNHLKVNFINELLDLSCISWFNKDLIEFWNSKIGSPE